MKAKLLVGDFDVEDTLYVGDLKAGQRVALRDRYCKVTHNDGVWRVELCDDADCEDVAEWGSSVTSEEEAWRYALGALFGPVDAEYDEDRLRAWLDIHKDPNPAMTFPEVEGRHPEGDG